MPETQGRITCSGNELAIMADVNESALAELLKASNPAVFAVRPISFLRLHYILLLPSLPLVLTLSTEWHHIAHRRMLRQNGHRVSAPACRGQAVGQGFVGDIGVRSGAV